MTVQRLMAQGSIATVLNTLSFILEQEGDALDHQAAATEVMAKLGITTNLAAAYLIRKATGRRIVMVLDEGDMFYYRQGRFIVETKGGCLVFRPDSQRGTNSLLH